VAERHLPEDLGRLSDEDLLALATAGEEQAFGLLYDRHARVAFSLAYRLLGDRESAEDLVQDAFLAVWRGSASYSAARGSVRTWLLGILHHRGVDRLRTQSAIGRRQEALEQAERYEAAEPDAADEVIGRAEARDLRKALDQLPGDQLRVIKLAYYGGFTHQEIAEMLDVPLGTVKSRMRLALERIRRGIDGTEVARA
jgi:RNA polymerase sigma-70 factor (ECF subfamily)